MGCGGATLRSRHSVLVQVAGNGVRGLALRALPHNAGHHVVWHRPWSPEATPWSRRTASASRVRLRMKSRESSAKTTAMCAIALPIGVPHRVVPSHGRLRLIRLRFPGW